ncbi:MAG: hypothetical protein ACJAYG_001389 [Oceanicoccus sp.]|jgi:hypothetical protein
MLAEFFMSHILKIERQSGTRYKATIKHGSKALKSKTFTKQKSANESVQLSLTRTVLAKLVAKDTHFLSRLSL